MSDDPSAPQIPTDERGFQRALDELRRATADRRENPGSYQSEGCIRCAECTFTKNSSDCVRCTYCERCERCSDCTQCSGCVDVHQSSYCVDSERVYRSQYLVRSSDCYECTFCYGCVGLVRKEFHILNRAYPRKVYFRLIKQLEEARGARRGK